MKHITLILTAIMGVLFAGARPMEVSAKSASAATPVAEEPDSLGWDYHTQTMFHPGTVYRIQIYSGNNGRKSKEEAYRMAALSREFFPLLPTYCSYKQPRWICRVGNFRTAEDAQHYLRLMRGTTQFPYATLVKSQIKGARGSNPTENNE